ncbi:MAG: phosphate acyltransferase PlsX [Candidatus Lindowbacteria bacterium]|nr:phosphate acyltransferase PlsX [Candidatus Lindowbacteria bacterium]
MADADVTSAATIAIDAAGGDKGVEVVVQGVLAAHAEYDNFFRLYGDKESILSGLRKHGAENDPRICVVHAPDVITMDDSPVEAIRTKKESSLVLAAKDVKKGEASALISPGNTGAVLAAGTLIIGRIRGVERPGIATILPTKTGHSVLIDVGANAESRPTHLVHFGIMGAIYAKAILGFDKPRIGLLSVGEERKKGNELTLQALPLFEKLFETEGGRKLGTFQGNVEGRDIVNGKSDVIVCDGFVGNVVLKFGEALSFTILDLLKERLVATPMRKAAAFILKGAFKEFKKRIDYTEYGGAPLLGVKHPCIICHGSSGPNAIKNAIRVSREALDSDICSKIESLVKELETTSGSDKNGEQKPSEDGAAT